MNILLYSKTMAVTEAMREFATEQVGKIARLSQRVTNVRIFLENVKTSQGKAQHSMVKVQVELPGKDVVTSSKADDLYVAISRAVANAQRAVRKQKERRITKKTSSRFHSEQVHIAE